MTVKELIDHLSERSPREKVYIIRTAWEEYYVDDIDYDDLIIGGKEHKQAVKVYEW